MPIFAYDAQWDPIKDFFAKCRGGLPPGYTGLAAIRLHRTGHPLTLELLGGAPPERPLYPLLMLKLDNGELTRDWDDLEVEFDSPFVKEADFHDYRADVMKFYHEEDALEQAAQRVIESDDPGEAALSRVIVDRADARV